MTFRHPLPTTIRCLKNGIMWITRSIIPTAIFVMPKNPTSPSATVMWQWNSWCLVRWIKGCQTNSSDVCVRKSWRCHKTAVAATVPNGPTVLISCFACKLTANLGTSAGLLNRSALGQRARNSTRFFPTGILEQLGCDEKWLVRATDAIANYWKQRNARKKAVSLTHLNGNGTRRRVAVLDAVSPP